MPMLWLSKLIFWVFGIQPALYCLLLQIFNFDKIMKIDRLIVKYIRNRENLQSWLYAFTGKVSTLEIAKCEAEIKLYNTIIEDLKNLVL